ncbi:BatD family protein [Marinobacter sp. C2H3]|uniref:BatD family protein n=1 Tax=Marinobacter sp. C2H3 TaxID=3119003 RepID=UPI00300E89F9
MVNRFLALLAGFGVLLALAAPALAKGTDTLTVEPDRTQLYDGDVLTLTVKGSMKLDLSLTDLFDLNLSDLPAPDIDKVSPDFKVLAKNQRYSVQTVNGETVGNITWTYQLAPTRTGTLTIPALTFKGATSAPVTIEVKDGPPPATTGNGAPRDSFIELSADKNEVYVQEQLTLTIKLFFTGNLIRGELSEPSDPDTVVEPLGKQSEYTRYRDGVRYQVVERRYALFPQKPGELDLAPIRFEGQARTPEGRLKFLRDRENFFTFTVKDVPDSFSGDTWLPAESLTLADSGLPDNGQVAVGDNLTRTLTLTARGLPAETLPPLPDSAPDGLKAYPDQPERNTDKQRDGLTGTLTETSALVPVTPGNHTLPEIRIPWWDTTTDSEKVAVIPSRTLTVAAAPQAAASPSPAGSDSGTTPPDSAQPPTNQTPEAATESGGHSAGYWLWISLALGLAWLATLVAWYLSRRASRATLTGQIAPKDAREKEQFDALMTAVRAGSAEAPAALIRWLRARHPGRSVQTLDDALTLAGDTVVREQMQRLQARRFAANPAEAPGPDLTALVSALEALRQRSDGQRRTDALPPLYPDTLSGR